MSWGHLCQRILLVLIHTGVYTTLARQALRNTWYVLSQTYKEAIYKIYCITAMIKELTWRQYTGNSDCILDIYDNFSEYKLKMLNCKHERREGEREEQEGDKERKGGGGWGGERRQLHNRNYGIFSSVPLLSPDSTRSIRFTNCMKNADIGGQMSFLIVLCMTDYLVFYLQVAITDFFLHV